MSIYQYTTKKDGKLYGVRFVSIDEGTRKNLRGYRTKKEAQAAEYDYQRKAEYIIRLRKKAAEDNARISFAELFDLYRCNYLMTLAPSSMYDYIRMAERYLLPTFGGFDIRAISRKQVTLWQDGLSSTLSSKYKRKIRSLLSSVLTYAAQRDMIDNNPVENVVPIKRTEPKKEIVYWTKEEYDTFIDVVDDPLYHALFYFLYNTGCRKGEAFALRREDVDFDGCVVYIRRNLTKKGQIMSRNFGREIVETTKNKKTGTLKIPPSLVEELRALPSGEFMFGKDSPLSENTVRRRMNYFISIAGVKKIHVHALRHSCAALMISTSSGGIDTLYAVAERLRDTPDQILKTYGHLFPSRNSHITSDFLALF